MQRKTMVSVSCAAVLCAAGMAQAQTYWRLLETGGGIEVGANSTNTANHSVTPPGCGKIPDWGFNNGAGLSDSFILSEDGGLNGVYFYASVQYLIESSSGGLGPLSLTVDRTLEARVGTIVGGQFTTDLPTIPFLQQHLSMTPFSGEAKARFNFEALKCCECEIVPPGCDLFEADTGNGFEDFCTPIVGSCIVRWLAGADEIGVSFSWDPSGNGGTGSLMVDGPIFDSQSGTITPAPSSALLAVLGFGIAARRRR